MTNCIDHGRRLGHDAYAVQWRNGKQYTLHRLVLADKLGIDIVDLSFDYVARHTCDNRRCINPEHLVLGTRKDNTEDMVERGRFRSKLSADEVREILLSTDPVKILADRFHVSRHTISRIRKGTTWDHLGVTAVECEKLTSRGERNGNSVLTEASVREILQSKESQRSLAKRYGVSQYAIWAVKNGKTFTNRG